MAYFYNLMKLFCFVSFAVIGNVRDTVEGRSVSAKDAQNKMVTKMKKEN